VAYSTQESAISEIHDSPHEHITTHRNPTETALERPASDLNEAQVMNQLTMNSSQSSSAETPNQSMNILMIPETNQNIDLKAMETTKPGFFHHGGELDPSQSSFVAFGFQFDLEPSARTSEEK
jgi:hypothetical protein